MLKYLPKVSINNEGDTGGYFDPLGIEGGLVGMGFRSLWYI